MLAAGQSLPRRRASACGAVLALALASGGCSISFPIFGISGESKPDVQTTASISPRPTPKASPLATISSELGPEDLRRADGAMALALDPQGNGASVSWDNPQSGIKGSFIPVGGPFLRSDEICRAFIAEVQTQMRPAKLQGTACRPSGGEWAVL